MEHNFQIRGNFTQLYDFYVKCWKIRNLRVSRGEGEGKYKDLTLASSLDPSFSVNLAYSDSGSFSLNLYQGALAALHY